MKRALRLGVVVCVVCCIALPAQADQGESPRSLIVSWSAFSKQFIDAPEFRLLPLPGTVEYRAVISQDGLEWTVQSGAPLLNLSTIWSQVKDGSFSLTFRWNDAQGAVLKEETSERVKAPDFAGFNEPAMDWSAAADRNIAYLIHESDRNTTAPYREPGVPVWIWAATPTHVASYPCITINNMIWAFLAHARNGGPQSEEALRLARVSADWALVHRQPDDGALPLFPYSTITKGSFGGHVEGESVNLLRASWFAISFVDLYAVTQHEPYLEYARHIADTTVKFQNADGSFPYRVDPKNGAVTEQYNCSVMEFVELVEKLEPFGFDVRRAMAAQRALEWVRTYVLATNNWKAAYEDVGETRFYTNLSQMPAQQLIRYLCRHKDENPAYLPEAIQLNRWVEDQFVTFGPGNAASPVRVKGPLVFEQFICWWPMDGHTANWILSLIELHKATGERVYLDKARAAANAICAEQFEDGQFSTWGRDFETGESRANAENWYNAGAFSDWALYTLVQYVRGLNE
ncbi:MAG: hypothetical protein IT364_25195 [Candidatus Hydrogenedentes bacterium]|nr:hypothetical protein [Candidatus Hydrogenedentota bacterium]